MHTLISIVHSWNEALYVKGCFARVVLLDYWKAFDCYDCGDLDDKIVEYPPCYCSLAC